MTKITLTIEAEQKTGKTLAESLGTVRLVFEDKHTGCSCKTAPADKTSGTTPADFFNRIKKVSP